MEMSIQEAALDREQEALVEADANFVPRPLITLEDLERFAAAAPEEWKGKVRRGKKSLRIDCEKTGGFVVTIYGWHLYTRMAFAGFILGWLGLTNTVTLGTIESSATRRGHVHLVKIEDPGGAEFVGRGTNLGEACFFAALNLLEDTPDA